MSARSKSDKARSRSTEKGSARPEGPDDPNLVRKVRDDARELFRRAVLDAAERVFSTEGSHAARIQDIAKVARVSVGTIYNHFSHKREILSALIDERLQELSAAFREQTHDPPDFVSRFRAHYERALVILGKHARFFHFAMHEGLFELDAPPKWSALAIHETTINKYSWSLLEEMLLLGMKEGVVEHQDVDRLIRLINGAMRSVIIGAIGHPGGDPVADGRFAVEMLLRAMKPPVDSHTSPTKNKGERAGGPASPTKSSPRPTIHRPTQGAEPKKAGRG